MTAKLPDEINGENVDQLCLATAQLFKKYGINFTGDKELLIVLADTIGCFLEEKCQIFISGNMSLFISKR